VDDFPRASREGGFIVLYLRDDAGQECRLDLTVEQALGLSELLRGLAEDEPLDPPSFG
jgi:hypothetical protein